MKSENKDKHIDDLISKAIGNKQCTFDFDQWKQDHPEQLAAYKKQTASRPHKLIKYAGILTAAAMILLTVMLLPDTNDNNTQPVEYQAKILMAKISLPAGVPTIARLNLIFKKSDMDAVDKFNEQAAKKTGLQPEKMTAQQLLEEMETDSNKTKGNSHEKRSYNSNRNIRDSA